MNPIEKALDEIRFQIPRAILDIAYAPRDVRISPELLSLDSRIREKVLEPRVLIDIDIIGSTEAYIPLHLANVEQYDPLTAVYYIPSSATDNRPIVQCYSIHFGILGYGQSTSAYNFGQSTLAQGQQAILDATIQSPPAATSFINLVAPNAVMVRYVAMPYQSGYLRCRLGNEESLSHLNTQFILAFAELCVLATKADLFNRLLVELDQGYLSGGQQLGTIRDTVSGYQDAQQMYQEALIRWRKLMVMNDPYAHRRMLKQQIF